LATVYWRPAWDLVVPRFSTCLGISVSHRVSRSGVFIETGLCLMDRGYNTRQVHQDGSGNELVETSREFDYYLMVPASIGTQLGRISFSAGLSFNHYVARRFYLNNQFVTDSKIPIAAFAIGAQFSAGYGVEVGPNFKLICGAYVNAIHGIKFFNYGAMIRVSRNLSRNKN